MTAPAEYRGALTREQWLATETRTVARLFLDDGIETDRELVAFVRDNNPFLYPTEREVVSIARACARRLRALSGNDELRRRLWGLIAHGTADQLHQTNLYALMRDNRIVWEFVTCVTARKFASFDCRLASAEVTTFLTGLRSQSEKASRWSDATMTKIRQVLLKCLAECGMYERTSHDLKPLILDFELEQIIRANGDAEILPGLGLYE